MQLDYSNTPDVAYPGMIADARPKEVVTGINEEAVAIPFGVGVVQGTDDNEFLLPSAQGQTLKGVTLHQHRADNSELAGVGAIPAAETNPIIRKGPVWVLVEDAVDKGAPAFCRHTSDGGSNTQKGKWRSDNDGVAQVTTVTPSAANSTKYGLLITIAGRTFRFEYTSDSASSATEICDGLRAAMALDTAFTALITPSGTATLVLTGADKGVPFDVVSDGSAGTYTSITTGTAASTRADSHAGAVFGSSTAGAGLAILELNLP